MSHESNGKKYTSALNTFSIINNNVISENLPSNHLPEQLSKTKQMVMRYWKTVEANLPIEDKDSKVYNAVMV